MFSMLYAKTYIHQKKGRKKDDKPKKPPEKIKKFQSEKYLELILLLSFVKLLSLFNLDFQ